MWQRGPPHFRACRAPASGVAGTQIHTKHLPLKEPETHAAETTGLHLTPSTSLCCVVVMETSTNMAGHWEIALDKKHLMQLLHQTVCREKCCIIKALPFLWWGATLFLEVNHVSVWRKDELPVGMWGPTEGQGQGHHHSSELHTSLKRRYQCAKAHNPVATFQYCPANSLCICSVRLLFLSTLKQCHISQQAVYLLGRATLL